MPKRVLQGVVVSTKADITATVLVERRVPHPRYGKIVKVSKKYRAHDEKNKCQEGEKVFIRECKPLSKTKSWEVIFDAA